jgi:hypothetical protein
MMGHDRARQDTTGHIVTGKAIDDVTANVWMTATAPRRSRYSMVALAASSKYAAAVSHLFGTKSPWS